MAIDYDVWIEAVRRAQQQQPDGLTSRELAGLWGVSAQVANRKIRDLAGLGQVRCNGRRRVERVDGVMGEVPVYVLIDSKPKRKR